MNTKNILSVLLILASISGCTTEPSPPTEKPIIWSVEPSINNVFEGTWAIYRVNIVFNREMDPDITVKPSDDKSPIDIDASNLVNIGKHYANDNITRTFKAKGWVYTGSAIEHEIEVILKDNMNENFNESKTVTLRVTK